MIMAFVKWHAFLIVLTFLSFFVRTLWLNLFPIGMTHDELNYIMNARSLFYSSQNIPWTASAIFSWGETQFDVVISELPAILIAPWIGLTKQTMFNARLPYAIVGTITIVIFYSLTKKLTGEPIARFAALALAVNPWSIHFNRTAFEINFAVMFYLLGIYFVISQKPRKIFLGLPFFVAGFLSYFGAKLIFLPLITISLIYHYFNQNKKPALKPHILFFTISLLFFLFYYFTLPYQPAGSRKGELILFNNHTFSETVNLERQQSLPNPLNNIFSNKVTVVGKTIINTYLEAFSTRFLFITGETRGAYSFWRHGPLYILDFPLIIFGLIALYTLKRKAFWFTLAVIALAPTISAIDLVEQSFVIRAALMFPMFMLLVGSGLYFIKNKLMYGKYLFWGISGLYLLFIANFMVLYFFRYPVYASEGFFLSERILASYVAHTQSLSPDTEIVVITPEPKIVFEEYLFFNNLYTATNAKKINEQMTRRDFSWMGVVFTNRCPDEKNKKIIIADQKQACGQKENGDLGIVQFADAGLIYLIKNDNLCNNYRLGNYYYPQSSGVLKIEELSREDFCKSWITRQ